MDAAWVGAGGVLTGVIVTQVASFWLEHRRSMIQAAERQRDRGHERDLRTLEFAHARSERLYADRAAAYTEFRRSLLRYMAIGSQLGEVVTTLEEDDVVYAPFDLVKSEIRELMGADESRWTESENDLDHALYVLELVASAEVQAAARLLRSLATEERRTLRHAMAYNDNEDDFLTWLDIFITDRKRTRTADAEFIDIIRQELES